MGGAGRFFQNHPKKTKIHQTCQLRVYLRKLMHSIVKKSLLSVFSQEFSQVVRLHVRPENEPKKNWSVPIFFGLSDRPKKKFALVRPPPPPPPPRKTDN